MGDKQKREKMGKGLRKVWKAWEKKGFFTPYRGGPWPTNEAIKFLHLKAKEEHDKAHMAWEEGGKKNWGSKKA